MKTSIKLALFLTFILALFTIVLCTDNSHLFSFSIAMIFTSAGVLIGQFIKHKNNLNISISQLWMPLGLFLLAIVLSLCFYFLLDDIQNRIIYIVLTNTVLAVGSIIFLLVRR